MENLFGLPICCSVKGVILIVGDEYKEVWQSGFIKAGFPVDLEVRTAVKEQKLRIAYIYCHRCQLI